MIKRLICKFFGHKNVDLICSDYPSLKVPVAKKCQRCGLVHSFGWAEIEDAPWLKALMRRLNYPLIIGFTALLLASCADRDRTSDELSQALAKASINSKISAEKVSQILQEYVEIESADPATAKTYANRIVAIINLGGDSTKIDAARGQFLSDNRVSQ
jgi:hypothetical protein